MVTEQTTNSEFSEIIQSAGESRPVMSVPPRVIASAKFIREVQRELDIVDDDRAREAADWIIDKMERFGAYTARAVFDLDGIGPQCSWCGAIWPLCGHHHQAHQPHDDDGDALDEAAGSEGTAGLPPAATPAPATDREVGSPDAGPH